ncbi:MAG TPA: hypothetical protein VN456_10300 [Desulfosporosinus sp.]|nr:hypothetical protein [Desulfosporosinus sp.]
MVRWLQRNIATNTANRATPALSIGPTSRNFNTDLTETRKGKSSKELDAMRVSILEAEFESEARDEPEEESEDELEP